MKQFLAGATSCCLIACTFLPIATSNASLPAAQLYLYKTTFVQAAPGKLLDLIKLFKDRMAVYDASGDQRPFWWRHTQGDHWDLMLLFPMGSYTEYFAPDRVARRNKGADSSPLSQQDFARKFSEFASWHEDLFVEGPPLERVKEAFANTSYYHIEIFKALPGKQSDLRKEREMENAYQKGIGRPETLVFTRDQGADWDLFSLGFYRDLKHWSESQDVPKEKRDAAARAAGFTDADQIGPFMRTLIYTHQDTMGVAIR